jgi:biopolymer transport protein ExbD
MSRTRLGLFMAEKRRFLDVWIIEGNTVYKEVPYEVVMEWVQQGRLLGDDRLKPSGTAQWFQVGDMPAFKAFLAPEPVYAAQVVSGTPGYDQPDLLEPIELDFSWKPRRDPEEEDVDMIPLIDISLVLLIFFMMTSTVAVAGAAAIRVPTATRGATLAEPKMVWLGIDKKADGQPEYSLGLGNSPAKPENRGLTQTQALQRLEELTKEQGPADVRLMAHRSLP